MTDSRRGLAAATAIMALGCAAISTGCGAAGPEVESADVTASAGQGGPPAGGPPTDGASTGDDIAGPARTEPEQQFLDQLAAFGVPTDMTSDTTVEVGIGICRSIADGADTATILDRIQPLSRAVAAHDTRRDTAEVGRAIVDASRTHLCG